MGWLAGWNYRKSHALVGQAGAGTGYQVKLKLYSDQPAGTNYGVNNGWGCTLHDTNAPAAIYYNGKVYIAYLGGGAAHPWIVSYTVATEVWSAPVKVATSPIPADNHGAPSIAIDQNGRIHVFYGCHVSTMYHSMSTNPEDITAWTAMSAPDNHATYPSCIKANNGYLYLFFRGGSGTYPLHMRISTDDGANWGGAAVVLELTSATDIYRIDTRYDPDRERIHLCWTKLNGTRQNTYHAYYYITDGHWHSAAGTNLGTSITEAEADSDCKAYNNGTTECKAGHVDIDGNGDPFIVFTALVSGVYKRLFTRWDPGTSAWTAATVVLNNQDNSGVGEIIVASGTGSGATVEVYSPDAADSPEKMKKIVSTDGGATWGSPASIQDPEQAASLYFVWKVVNRTSDFKVVFAEATAGGAGDADRVYMYGDRGIIRNVPLLANEASLNSHGLSDFGDVRFTAADGTSLLDYWFESKVDGNYVIVWVKVAADLGSNQTIYVYYGKAAETTTSSGPNTFPDLFDHFDDSSLNSTLWGTVLAAGGAFSESGTLATLTQAKGINILSKLYSKSGFSTGKALRTYAKTVTPALSVMQGFGFLNGITWPTRGSTIQAAVRSFDANQQNSWTRTAAGDEIQNITTIDSYHIWDVERNSSTSVIYFKDGVASNVHTSKVPTDTMPFEAYCDVWNNANPGGVYVDWVLVRNFINPEPTHGAWGSEELGTIRQFTIDGDALGYLRHIDTINGDALGFIHHTYTINGDAVGYLLVPIVTTGGSGGGGRHYFVPQKPGPEQQPTVEVIPQDPLVGMTFAEMVAYVHRILQPGKLEDQEQLKEVVQAARNLKNEDDKQASLRLALRDVKLPQRSENSAEKALRESLPLERVKTLKAERDKQLRKALSELDWGQFEVTGERSDAETQLHAALGSLLTNSKKPETKN